MSVTLAQLSSEELLSCLKTDLTMLRSGEWIPDKQSIDASIDVVQELEQRLNEEKDVRGSAS